MDKTFNRYPTSFPVKSLDEKYFNFAEFKGLCTNDNVITIDQQTFREAVNVYRDDNDQLSTRPPLIDKPNYPDSYPNYKLSKIMLVNGMPFNYFTRTIEPFDGIVYFETNNGTVGIAVDGNPENVNIVWVNDFYILFSKSDRQDLNKIIGLDINFSTKEVTQYDAGEIVYIPVTKTISGTTITENEEGSPFVNVEIWRYLFTAGTVTVTDELYYKDVVVHIADETFNIQFVPGNELVFTESVGQINNNIKYNTLVTSRTKTGIVRGSTKKDFYFTLDCVNYYPLPVPDELSTNNIFTISEDGLSLYIVDLTSSGGTEYDTYAYLYYANVSVNDPGAISNIQFSSKLYYCYIDGYECNVHDGSRMLSTSITTHTNYSLLESGAAIHSPEQGSLIFTFARAGFSYRTFAKTGGTGYEVGSASEGNVYEGTGYGASVWVLSDNKITSFFAYASRTYTEIDGVTLTKTSDGLNYATFMFDAVSDSTIAGYHYLYTAFNDQMAPYYSYQSGGLMAIKRYFFDNENDYSASVITGGKIRASYSDKKYSVSSVIRQHTDSNYILTLLKLSGTFSRISNYDTKYYTDKYTYSYNSSSGYSNYGTREQYPVVNEYDLSKMSGRNTLTIYNDTINISNFILGFDGTILTNTFLYNDNRNIQLLKRTAADGSEISNIPLYCDSKTIIYSSSNGNIYSNIYNAGQVYVDLQIINGDAIKYETIVPLYNGQLDYTIYSNSNKLYITSPTIKGKQLYVKNSDVLTLPSEITGIVNFSTTSLGIFMENEVYELQLTEAGYKLTKTKLQLGNRKGSDIMLTYDGANILITTLKGLNVLTYQDFVQSTDQVLSYLTENIITDYDKFNTAPIKLYQYKNWIFMYKVNSPDILLYDLRNKSWWFWTSRHAIEQLFYYDGVLCVLSDGNVYYYDKHETTSYDGIAEQIQWKIVSQRLHFSAPNNYKHIRNFSILSSTEDDKQAYIQCKLTFKNYHNIQQFSNDEVVEYEVNQLSTYIKKLNFMKTNALQFTIESNNYDNPVRFLTPNIAIKFRVTERIR